MALSMMSIEEQVVYLYLYSQRGKTILVESMVILFNIPARKLKRIAEKLNRKHVVIRMI